MQQTFNFQRWSLLVGNHWAENKKRYLLSIAAYMSLLFVWFIFVMVTDPSNPLAENLQEVSFYFSLFLVGPFYASQYFKDLSSKAKGTNYLLVPASTFEKFLCSIFYTLIVFLFIIIPAFYLVDAIAVFFANLVHPGYDGSIQHNGIPVKASIANVFRFERSGDDNIPLLIFLLFAGVQSAALLGSVYFGQYSYIKTAIALTLLLLLIALIENWLMHYMGPRGSLSESISRFQFYQGNKIYQIQLPVWVGKALWFLFRYSIQPVLWLATYFRLKEKEV
jgi:hypothetical protein